MDELALAVTCDVDGLTAGMTEARVQIEQTTLVIAVQDQSWKSFSSSVLGSIAKIVAPILQLANTYKKIQLATMALTVAQTAAIPPTLTLAGAMGVLLSPITLTVGALAALAGVVYYFTRSSGDAAEKTDKVSDAVEKQAGKVKSLSDIWAAAAASPFNEEIVRKVGQVDSEWDKLKGKLSDLKDSLLEPFVDGATAIVSYIPTFLGVGDAADLATAALKRVNSAVDDLRSFADTSKTSLLAMALAFSTGVSFDTAKGYVEAGQAMKQQAADAEALTKKLEGQREGFAKLREIQENATAKATQGAEVAGIGKLFDVQAIDEQVNAIRQRHAAAIQAGTADEEWTRHAQALFDALAKQRQGVIDGTIVDRAAEEAKKAQAKAAEDAAKANKKAIEDEINAIVRKEKSMQSLRDQVDLLTGATTKADLAFRDALQEGFTLEQAEERRALTAQLEELQGKKKGSASDRTSPLKAALAGSSEAASIMLRGVGGGKSVEEIANKQLNVQQQMLAAIKANKPPAMQATNLGVA